MDTKPLHNLWALLLCSAGKRIRSPRYLIRNKAAHLNIRLVHPILPLLPVLGHKEVVRRDSVGPNSTKERRSTFLTFLDRVVRIAKAHPSTLPSTLAFSF